ncbi:MAG: hypothetical protein Q9227_006606 [Pyrenula ochraceoflavens]
MAFTKYILPALAAATTVYAQCNQSKVTIQNQGDATALQNCESINGDVTIAPQASGQIQLNGVQRITGDFTVNNATGLTALTSDQLSSIGGRWVLQDLTILSTLQFDSLTSVGTIEWTALPALQALSFGQGITKAQNVGISNTQLANLDGIELMQVQALDINNNNFMTDINVNNLKNITGITNFGANGQSLSIKFPNLQGAGNMTFRNISNLEMPSLARINGALGLFGNAFQTFSAPNLTVINGDLSINNCDNLNNLTMPELGGVNGGFGLANNPKLSNLNGFPGLQVVAGAIDVSGPVSKFSLPKLRDARGLFNFQTTENFDCSAFQKDKDSRVIKGTYKCLAKQQKPGGADSTSTASSSSSSSTGKSGAGHLEINIPAALTLGSLLVGYLMV